MAPLNVVQGKHHFLLFTETLVVVTKKQNIRRHWYKAIFLATCNAMAFSSCELQEKSPSITLLVFKIITLHITTTCIYLKYIFFHPNMRSNLREEIASCNSAFACAHWSIGETTICPLKYWRNYNMSTEELNVIPVIRTVRQWQQVFLSVVEVGIRQTISLIRSRLMARTPPQLTSAEPSETFHSTKLTNDIEASRFKKPALWNINTLRMHSYAWLVL